VTGLPGNDTVSWRLKALEAAVKELETHMDLLGAKLDRLMMALVGASLTVAISVIVFALTFTTGKP
jgi:hypothetical protein